MRLTTYALSFSAALCAATWAPSAVALEYPIGKQHDLAGMEAAGGA